jgi:hypothetical protein
MSRNELVNYARILNIDASTYANDSKLEQAVLYKLKTAAAAAGTATYLAIPGTATQTLSGGANV